MKIKRYKVYNLLLIMIILQGCSTQKDVQLEVLSVIEVNQYENTCELITTINDEEISEDNIIDNNITVDDIKIICPDNQLDLLGEQTLKYNVNGQYKEFNVNIVDTTPPVLEIEDLFEVEVDNIYFDLNNFIEASDNYDQEVQTTVDGFFDISRIGLYELRVIASDTTGNITSKNIEVNVIEKEKEVVVVTPTPEVNNSENYSNDYSSNSESTPTVAPTATPTAVPTVAPTIAPTVAPTTSTPYINGVRTINIAIDSSIHDLTYSLQSGITSSSSYSIDYAEVNLSVPGTYTVYYYGSDGASASCSVIVE